MSSTSAAHQGKYTHPWLTPLAPGKARVYDLAYKTVATALIAFSAYGFFEVGRGSYYIVTSNRQRAAEAAAQTTPAKQAAPEGLPWKVEWQVGRPGSTVWRAFDRGALVKHEALVCSGWSQQEFDQRLAQLVAVLPDLPRALPKVPPAVLVAALRDPVAVGHTVIALKGALPNTNVGVMLLLHPPLLALDAAAILSGLAELRQAVGAAAADELTMWYPALLVPDVQRRTLAEVRRVMPHLLKRTSSKDMLHVFGIVMKSDAVLGQGSGWDPTEPA